MIVQTINHRFLSLPLVPNRRTRRIVGGSGVLMLLPAAIHCGFWVVVLASVLTAVSVPMLVANAFRQNAETHGISSFAHPRLASISSIDVDRLRTRVDIVTLAMLRSMKIKVTGEGADVRIHGLCGSALSFGDEQVMVRGGLPTVVKVIGLARLTVDLQRITTASLVAIAMLTVTLGLTGSGTYAALVLYVAALGSAEIGVTYVESHKRFAPPQLSRFQRRMTRKLETAFRSA